MKRIMFTGLLIATASCMPINSNALPSPSKQFYDAHLVSSSRKNECPMPAVKEKILDKSCTRSESILLLETGVQFHPIRRSEVDMGQQKASALMSEVEFDEKAETGKILDQGKRAIILFKSGKVRSMYFTGEGIKTYSFMLFEKPLTNKVLSFNSGNALWFVAIGTPTVMRLEWDSPNKIGLRHFDCDNIKEIKQNNRFEYGERSFRIFEGDKLLEEIKAPEKK